MCALRFSTSIRTSHNILEQNTLIATNYISKPYRLLYRNNPWSRSSRRVSRGALKTPHRKLQILLNRLSNILLNTPQSRGSRRASRDARRTTIRTLNQRLKQLHTGTLLRMHGYQKYTSLPASFRSETITKAIKYKIDTGNLFYSGSIQPWIRST